MDKFLSNCLRFSIPGAIIICCILILYTYLDPFKVIYDYDVLLDAKTKVNVTLNKDYVSTTTFIKGNKYYNYNSFIFGNSRSIFYQISDWKKYIDENDKCFHFDASGEGLWALEKKIQFIDKANNKLKNIILVLDYSTLTQVGPNDSHLRIISPPLVNNSNLLKFHFTFIKAFSSPKFLYAFLDYKITNHFKSYMKSGFLLDNRERNYDPITNELRFDKFEKLISEGKYYTHERMKPFYKRNSKIEEISPQCIFNPQKELLSNIATITKKHNTNLKIIINPLYDQLKLNSIDLKFLNQLFGDENIYDFSGINKFTNDYKNYYENSHYRPHVAKEILKNIYNDIF
ncbi:hypothetical protein EI427_06635 [Flammeovirga pectinis]|uniref:SGNH/GDSL hydrolase family protein n=1 Tax=Flammeovirga pectinis TaxID=2494373 RepID=A0A3Q9FQ16_9BACT|nr:hypothetical protein [Flammeovirga pectinis]AZQ61925.1 hypothetical protein EI427_06635 [Flammeovirga pectinis]